MTMDNPKKDMTAHEDMTAHVPPSPKQMTIFDELSMDSESAHVLGIVRHHSGKGNAIQVRAIADLTGIAPRVVRDIVKTLIEHHHIRIGSSLGHPSGYYMIETDEEAAQNEKTLRKLGISILVHAAVLKKLTIAEYLRGIQGEMAI